MARGLLAAGRTREVARMIEPLMAPLPAAPAEAEASQIVLRCLLARVRLLRTGDAARAHALLEAFAPSAVRARLADTVRAEVALWLGWIHAWQYEPTYDDARALNLLDEAARHVRTDLDDATRCWTLLGQAYAYFTIDEYPLMRRALEEAATVQEKLQDAQASLWLHDLASLGARFEGRFGQARAHVEALAAQARHLDDALAEGRALAYHATLDDDEGRAPTQAEETAAAATARLTGAAVRPGYPLLAAYRARIRARMRQGRWPAAYRLIDEALDATGTLPAAAAHLRLLRARLLVLQGAFDEAEALFDEMLAGGHCFQHHILASNLALARGDLLLRQEAPDRAHEWIERAYRTARETGHTGQQVRALFGLARAALALGDLDAARQHLAQTERYSSYFSVLPFAALRFQILGEKAQLEGNEEEARAFFAQALSANSLIGDVYSTAQVQLELARLGREGQPAQTRPLLEAALLTFERLQAKPERDVAWALIKSWPADAGADAALPEASLGAALARAALSVELVAEAWLQAAERLLPGRWIGVFRVEKTGTGQKIHEHGIPPAALPFPDPTEESSYTAGVGWLRLRNQADGIFFFAVVRDEEDPAWEVAQRRLRPWLPVATLALDHALLRAHRSNAPPRLDAVHEDLPAIPLDDFVYGGPAMKAVARDIHRIRASHSPVLITGESGTGKELIARAVHATSERKAAPFVAFNCSNVPHELFDSHLFGHEKGAFTGAARAHPGVIRAADGGTLFLDEIGDLPLDVQPKLLRFLQEAEVFPLGARRAVTVDVRVVAATNHNLEARIREGRFREDLYYRLNVIPLRVPPLRQRREEIPLLVRHFLETLRPAGAPPPALTPEAMEALLRYAWPGNVRQLRNEIERALVFVSSEPAPLVALDDLSPAVRAATGAPIRPATMPAEEQILQPGCDLDQVLAGAEKKLIERVLAECGGQVTASADVLGLTRQGLYKKMKRLGIDTADFQKNGSRLAEISHP